MSKPKHSAQALGQDYINHVMAMTSEKLHEKSEIAVQLAWRDAELRRLHEENQFQMMTGYDMAKAEYVNRLIELEEVNAELLEALKDALELAQREYSTASTVTLGSLQHKKYDGTPTKLFNSKTFNLEQWEKIIAKAEGEMK